MLEQLNKRIEEVKAQIALRDELQRKAVEGQETLSKGAYQLDSFEIQLEILVEEIRKLEQFGLASLVAALSGERHEKIDARRAEYDALEKDYRLCSETIAHLEEELPRIEGQLAEFGDLDAELASLSCEKVQLLADSGDDSALRLQQLADALAKAQDKLKKTKRAVDVGQGLLASLEMTHRTARRVRAGSGRISGRSAGGALISAAVSVAYDKYKENLATKITLPLYDSLKRFRDAVFDLDLSDETPEDKEIQTVLPEIDLKASVQLDENDDTWIEVQSLVSNMLDDLKTKLRHDRQAVETLEQEHQQTLDNA